MLFRLAPGRRIELLASVLETEVLPLYEPGASLRQELNLQPLPYENSALPVELLSGSPGQELNLLTKSCNLLPNRSATWTKHTGMMRIELTTFRSTGDRSKPLSYIPKWVNILFSRFSMKEIPRDLTYTTYTTYTTNNTELQVLFRNRQEMGGVLFDTPPKLKGELAQLQPLARFALQGIQLYGVAP